MLYWVFQVLLLYYVWNNFNQNGQIMPYQPGTWLLISYLHEQNLLPRQSERCNPNFWGLAQNLSTSVSTRKFICLFQLTFKHGHYSCTLTNKLSSYLNIWSRMIMFLSRLYTKLICFSLQRPKKQQLRNSIVWSRLCHGMQGTLDILNLQLSLNIHYVKSMSSS